MDLYYMPESPPCRAVLMVAKHLNIALKLKYFNLSTNEHLNDDFAKINPQRIVPTLVDNGFILWESRAIMIYLVEKYAPSSSLYPQDIKIRSKINQYLFFDIGTLYQAESDLLKPLLIGKTGTNEYKKKFDYALNCLNTFLKDKKYLFTDEITIADISIIASLSFAQAANFDFSSYKYICNWIKLCESLPYYKEINTEPMKNFTLFLNQKKQSLQC